jgi:squalene-hopene/tetraprenyl-beta-curcumene cyclase
MGAQGVYFFYDILAKCLSAYGQDLVPVKDKAPINWKAELAKKLVSLQKIEDKTGHGFWKNDVNRYWEDNAVLVTAYTLRALEAVAK